MRGGLGAGGGGSGGGGGGQRPQTPPPPARATLAHPWSLGMAAPVMLKRVPLAKLVWQPGPSFRSAYCRLQVCFVVLDIKARLCVGGLAESDRRVLYTFGAKLALDGASHHNMCGNEQNRQGRRHTDTM